MTEAHDEERAEEGRRRGSEPLITPYELAFGEAGFETRVFPRVVDDAEANDEDPLRRERFGFLSVAAEAVRDIVPPDAPPEAAEEYRCLLYHAFNFWRFGRRCYVLEPAVARYLVEAKPSLAGWELTLPHPSVYVQLPPKLFWASISTEAPPEPVDGFFATVSRGTDPIGPAYQELSILMVLGMRRGRAGFSVIAFDTEAGPGIPATWAEAPGREGAEDFANILPGGEMAGLYSILTTTEALKLLARALWYVDTHAELVGPRAAPERRAEERPGTVPFSRLPYFRVSLDGSAGAFAAQGAVG
ncbi:MAG TPA: hypothetical protein VFQ39_18660 [Longimicrobium sp.]|nr:hypothetical protein [Longimicrobium sp.]